ncbi:CDP-glucose 4,6-dehydratase [Qipengyuania sp. MTN3-11]|uniref:CDP-glucose 4,6-dehydratase n=1 Tax=Qipengyuania sp. MTN3-11 TaxID=3056557 RepID=UPI0036F206EA
MVTGAVDPEFWAGKRVFLTGHTGFKGSWLALWLGGMGAEIHGFALAPDDNPNLYDLVDAGREITSTRGDIRDLAAVRAAMAEADPEILIHMAAQSLVRPSYDDPVGTYATNVMGTVNVLEAARACPSLRAIVVVTTDKCYENREWDWGYRESEAMGGHDPYSSSKGCAELVSSAYRASFFASVAGGPKLATARAGNVIGGGDWARDRLVPDALRAFGHGQRVAIRNPLATRPWQHVLEPLSGYLVLAQALWRDGSGFAEGWNFGPRDEDARPVRWVVEQLAAHWGGDAGWVEADGFHPHEAHSLKLDISKARARLHWRPRWALEEAVERIVAWQKAWLDGADMRTHCLAEIENYTHTTTALEETIR